MNGYLSNPLVFIVQTIFGLYIMVIMLRFLLQLVRADFHNQLSQFIVKITTPVLRPVRRFVPAMGSIDTSSLVIAWALKSLELLIILLISGVSAIPIGVIFWAIPELVELIINIFLYSVLIIVVLSWVSPGNYNPAVALLQQLTQPVMRPAQNLIPPIGGLDLSPMAVLIGLTLLKMLIIPPLKVLTGSPF